MPLGLQEVEAHRISRQSAHEGGGAVRLLHGASLPPGDIPVAHLCLRLRGNIQWRIPMNLLGIKPATFRLEAQSLNQLRHRMLLFLFSSESELNKSVLGQASTGLAARFMWWNKGTVSHELCVVGMQTPCLHSMGFHVLHYRGLVPTSFNNNNN